MFYLLWTIVGKSEFVVNTLDRKIWRRKDAIGRGGGMQSKRKSNEDAFKNHTGEITQWTINFNAGLGEERVIRT